MARRSLKAIAFLCNRIRDELGRPPSTREWNSFVESEEEFFPKDGAIRKRFGSWDEFLARTLGWEDRDETVDFPDRKLHPQDVDAFLDTLGDLQDKALALDNERLNTERIIRTDKEWFPVVFTSDWHIGSLATDHRLFKRHLSLLRHPEIRTVFLGDGTDNFFSGFPNAHPVAQQIASPTIQKRIFWSVMEEIAPNLIAWLDGNHDGWRDEREIGYNTFKEKAGELGIPFSSAKMGVCLTIEGGPRYRLYMAHNLKGGSMYNPNHSKKRALMFDLSTPTDIVITGHTHNPTMAWEYWKGRPTLMITCGTFKDHDTADEFCGRFFSDEFGAKASVGTPMVAFNTRDHRYIPFFDVEAGLEFCGVSLDS